MRSQEDIQLIKSLLFSIEKVQSQSDAHYENYRQMLKRIDVMVKERDEARAGIKQLKQTLRDTILENSENIQSLDQTVRKLSVALNEVEQLKQALHDARLENSGQAALLERRHHIGEVTEMVRPEPSRLEIAATLVAGRFSSTSYVTEVKGTWIKYALEGADALIAAAKEQK